MENSNEATIIFDCRPENEGLARVRLRHFCTQLNPTLEEVADFKDCRIGSGYQLYHPRIQRGDT